MPGVHGARLCSHRTLPGLYRQRRAACASQSVHHRTPGAESGHRVRLRGQGGKGSAGGQAGDLVITFDVQPDRFYKRDGLDLIATVPINVAQAALGSRISVRTLQGKKVALRIPAGTSSGKRFRISGQGVERDGKQGDLLVEITITVPDTLNEAQEKAMREFAEASGLKY